MSINFQDSYGEKLFIERIVHQKKGFLGRTRIESRIMLKVGDEWAEFKESELSESFFAGENIAESVSSSYGPAFIANVDWAPESSLFQKQVSGCPKNWWVLCFMDSDSNPVKAAFAPEDFRNFLIRISS